MNLEFINENSVLKVILYYFITGSIYKRLNMRNFSMKYILLILSCFLILSCSSNIESDLKAQSIVDKAIEAHGGANYEHSEIQFDFRGKTYITKRQGNNFTYERRYSDTVGTVRDIYKNGVLQRIMDELPYELSDKVKETISESINSVFYFALLPYKLNDPAVIKQYLGKVEISGKQYHKIFVTFKKEGGGKDHSDEFIYWFHDKDYKMGYMAYNFHTSGGGTRFRKAYNRRVVNGIIFQDYINYIGDKQFKPIKDIDTRFKRGELKILSRIELKNIQVNKLK